MRKACYPGSFDPLSNGHLDIILRASKQFDELYILVSYNVRKKCTFTPKERVEMIMEVVKHYNLKNVKVFSSMDLVVKFCEDNNIPTIIRGLRNYMDYENEFSLYQFNRDINPNIETMLMFPTTRTQFVSSSSIKELIAFNLDISPYVPEVISKQIIEKLKQK